MKLALVLAVTSLQIPLYDAEFSEGENDRKDGVVFDQRSSRVSDRDAMNYLTKFGYLHPAKMKSSHSPGSDEAEGNLVEGAVKNFQGFYGLKKTGRLDGQTRELMAKPRCGVQDGGIFDIKISNLILKWKKNHLTYSIVDYTNKITNADVRKTMAAAFKAWARVTPLRFSEVPKGKKVDIRVRFGTGNHGDPWPFDGNGGILAHATFPENGVLHFDDDEPWTVMDQRNTPSQRIDLLAVAIHEIGHALGLGHSQFRKSIMYSMYNAPVDRNNRYVRLVLSTEDIRSIQALYGRSNDQSDDSDEEGVHISTTTVKPRRTTSRSPRSPCIENIEAVAAMPTGSGYLFSGDKVYEYDTNTNKIIRQSTIARLFPSGPPKVNAALYNARNSIMLLIQGNQIWGYHFSAGAFAPDNRFPKNLPVEIPWTPTGALSWPSQHQVLLGPNRSFSIYDENWNKSTMLNNIDKYFKGLPDNVIGTISTGGKYFVFTSDEVFEYDEKAEKSHWGKFIGEFIRC